MATLYVREVPEDLYETLRALAAERGESISNSAIALLRRAMRNHSPETRALLDEIEARRPAPKKRVPAAADLIRDDRNGR